MRASGSGWKHPQSLPGNLLGSPENPLKPHRGFLCPRAAAQHRTHRAANEPLGAAVGVLGNACRCAHIKGGTRVGVGGSHECVCDSESERAHTRVHGCSTGVGARSAGVGVHRLGVCVCTGGCGCAQHTAAPTCLGATQGCSPQNNLIFHQTNPFSPETNLFSLHACSPPPQTSLFSPLTDLFFPPLPPNHAVPPQWSAAGNRSTAPSASARGTTGSWGSTAWAGCCSGCRSCEMPASPMLRNSSDPPLSPPPINTACILSVSPHPSTMHSLKCWEMVLGCASAGNQALSPDPFCSQEYLQVLEIGSHPPPPPHLFQHLCPPHVGTCPLFTPNASPPPGHQFLPPTPF